MSVEDEIVALEAEFSRGVAEKDVPRLRQLLAPEYRLVGRRSTGTSDVPYDAWFAMLEGMAFEAYDLPAVNVRVFGDCAIATVDGYWRIKLEGRPIEERVFLTDVWVKRDGRWQVVHRHSSPYQA